MTTVTNELATAAEITEERPAPPGRRRLRPWLREGAPTWTWLGIGAVAIGFVLIVIAWGDVVGESQIYRQLPYIVSAGFSGIGFIIAGATIVNVTTRQRDTLQRNRQMERLLMIMDELRAISGPGNE